MMLGTTNIKFILIVKLHTAYMQNLRSH